MKVDIQLASRIAPMVLVTFTFGVTHGPGFSSLRLPQNSFVTQNMGKVPECMKTGLKSFQRKARTGPLNVVESQHEGHAVD